jgi:nucleotide-binding universal stress UspA family protein
MILITCTIATFVAQKGGQNIALADTVGIDETEASEDEKILIPISNPANIEELINLSSILKSRENKDGIFALNIIAHGQTDVDADRKAKKLLEKALVAASASDILLHRLLRYDLNVANAVVSVMKEQSITDLVLGLHSPQGLSESFLGSLTEGILAHSDATSYVYQPRQPIATIKRHIIVVPDKAETEIGFPFWLLKMWNIARNTGAKLVFYAGADTLAVIKEVYQNHPIEVSFKEFSRMDDFLILAKDLAPNDNLVVVMSREHKASFHEVMHSIPAYLNAYFTLNSFILVYPRQLSVDTGSDIDLNNPSLHEPIEKLDELGRTIAKLFRRK